MPTELQLMFASLHLPFPYASLPKEEQAKCWDSLRETVSTKVEKIESIEKSLSDLND